MGGVWQCGEGMGHSSPHMSSSLFGHSHCHNWLQEAAKPQGAHGLQQAETPDGQQRKERSQSGSIEPLPSLGSVLPLLCPGSLLALALGHWRGPHIATCLLAATSPTPACCHCPSSTTSLTSCLLLPIPGCMGGTPERSRSQPGPHGSWLALAALCSPSHAAGNHALLARLG